MGNKSVLAIIFRARASAGSKDGESILDQVENKKYERTLGIIFVLSGPFPWVRVPRGGVPWRWTRSRNCSQMGITADGATEGARRSAG